MASKSTVFGGQNVVPETTHKLSSTPVAVFHLSATQTLICLVDGTVGRITVNQGSEGQPKTEVVTLERTILCACQDDQQILLGTTKGLLVMDSQSGSVKQISDYENFVPCVRVGKSWAYACFMDLQNGEQQFQQGKYVTTIVRIDKKTWQIMAERAGQLNCGKFDVDDEGVYSPHQSGVIKVYDQLLNPKATLKIPAFASPFTHYIHNQVLISENGFAYFFSNHKMVDFQQRVNAVLPFSVDASVNKPGFGEQQPQAPVTKTVFLFGLQNGSVRCVDPSADFAWYNIKTFPENEVTALTGDKVNERFTIGIGSLQARNSPGARVECTIKFTGGLLVI